MSKYIKLEDAHKAVSSRTRLYELEGTGWIDVGLDQMPTVELNDEQKVYAIYYDCFNAGEKTFTPCVRFVYTNDIASAVLQFVTREIRPIYRVDTEALDFDNISDAMAAFEKNGWQVYMKTGVMQLVCGGIKNDLP